MFKTLARLSREETSHAIRTNAEHLKEEDVDAENTLFRICYSIIVIRCCVGFYLNHTVC